MIRNNTCNFAPFPDIRSSDAALVMIFHALESISASIRRTFRIMCGVSAGLSWSLTHFKTTDPPIHFCNLRTSWSNLKASLCTEGIASHRLFIYLHLSPTLTTIKTSVPPPHRITWLFCHCSEIILHFRILQCLRMGWALSFREELEEKYGRYRLQCERIMIIGPHKDNNGPLWGHRAGISASCLSVWSQPPTHKKRLRFWYCCRHYWCHQSPNPTYFTHKQMTALEIILVLPTLIAKLCELRKKMAHFEMGLFMLLGIYWLCRRCTAVVALWDAVLR